MGQRRAGTVAIACAALVAGSACTSWREQVAAARDDVTPEDVLEGRIPEADVVWVGRCLGPAPGMPWYLEFEWIPGPWSELRLGLDRTAHLPGGVGAEVSSRPTGVRFLVALDPWNALSRLSNPDFGLPTDGEFAYVGRPELRFGRATVRGSQFGFPTPLRPPLPTADAADEPEGDVPR